MKKFFTCLVVLILIVIVGGVGAFLYIKNYYESSISDNSGSGELVKVEIPAGSGSDTIGQILIEKGLISDINVFKYYLKDSGMGASLKAGKYEFRDTQTLVEIVDEMVVGAIEKGIVVTIPEGLRYDEIVDTVIVTFEGVEEIQLQKEELVKVIESPDEYEFSEKVELFLAENKPDGKNLEGFLFPDTFEFEKDVTALELVNRLVETHIERVKDLASTNEMSYYDSLILASILEREAFPNPGEYEEVAGIFLRRINAEDKLGADATVLYPHKRWKPEPRAAELREDTPYNTRKNFGLPPTPISNPGAKALEATLNAEESEFYYFLHDKNGGVHYSKTLSEHESKKNQYL